MSVQTLVATVGGMSRLEHAKISAQEIAKLRYSFDQLFLGDSKPIIQLAEEVLSPDGGFLFDGYNLDAPANFRKPLSRASNQEP